MKRVPFSSPIRGLHALVRGSFLMLAICWATVLPVQSRGQDSAETTAGAEEGPVGLPQPLDDSAYSTLLSNPPFTRALNLSESLVLTGVARIDGNPVVTVMDKNTNESFVVSAGRNNLQGWRLLEIEEGTAPEETQARLSVNGENISIRYGAAQLDPVADRGGGSQPGSADSGEDGDGERGRGSRRRGFDPELMQRMRSMSDEQRQQMRDYFNRNRDRLRGASSDERRQMIQQAIDRVERGSRRR